MTANLITWEPFFDALKEAGLLPDPDRTRRVIIDAQVGEPCKIIYETYGDERLNDILPSALIPADDPADATVR